MFSINLRDVTKGLITAIISSILTGIYTSIASNPPKFPSTLDDWKPILLVGLGAGISYILKNLFTNSNDQFMKKEKAN